MKRRIIIMVGILFILAVARGAGAVDYTLLEPIGSLPAGQPTKFSTYLEQMFVFLVQLGIGASVVMLVFAGVEFTMSGASETAKNDAKQRIWNTLVGLIVALAAYLLLNIINPDLVNFNLEIKPVKQPETSAAPSPSGSGRTIAAAVGGGGNAAFRVPANTTGSVAEATQRATLASNGALVNGNKPACPPNKSYKEVPGGCTSTDGMQSFVVDGTGYLRKKIGIDKLLINGGSEDGHSANGVNRNGGHSAGVAIDFAMDARITNYVTNGGTLSPNRQTKGGKYDIYDRAEGSFINEKNHWHWEPNPAWVNSQKS